MMREIFEAAAADAGMTLNEIRGPRRDRAAYHARQVAYAACREAGFTLGQIAKYVNRDHTTVLNGLQRYEQRNKLRQQQ
jgi:chromosomal replication initiation ATPase DnaA